MDVTYALDFGMTNSLIGLFDEKGNFYTDNDIIKKSKFYYKVQKDKTPYISIDPLSFGDVQEVSSFKRKLDKPKNEIKVFRKEKGNLTFKDNVQEEYIDFSQDEEFKYFNTYEDEEKDYEIQSYFDLGLKELFSELKRNIDQRYSFKEKSKGVVIGIPYKYGTIGKKRIKNAAVLSGLAPSENKVYFVYEPIAVLFQYIKDYNKKINFDNKIFLVVDLGGGTSDFSIIRVNDLKNFEVLAMSSIPLAGIDIDRMLYEYFIETLKPSKDNFENFELIRSTLRQNIEQIKIRISEKGYHVEKFFTKNGVEIKKNFTNEDIEKAIKYDYIAKIDEEIFNLLDKSSLTKEEIEKAILAGGTAELKAVQEYFKNTFEGKVILDYVGTKSTLAGLAESLKFQDYVNDLTDFEYGIFDYGKNKFISLVDEGINYSKIRDKLNYFYLMPVKKENNIENKNYFNVIIGTKVGNTWEPIGEISVNKSEKTEMFFLEFDRNLKLPFIKSNNKSYYLEKFYTIWGITDIDKNYPETLYLRKNDLIRIDGNFIGVIEDVGFIYPSEEKYNFVLGNPEYFRIKVKDIENMTSKTYSSINAFNKIEVWSKSLSSAVKIASFKGFKMIKDEFVEIPWRMQELYKVEIKSVIDSALAFQEVVASKDEAQSQKLNNLPNYDVLVNLMIDILSELKEINRKLDKLL